MTSPTAPAPNDRSSPFVRDTAGRLATALLIVAGLAATLYLMGHDVVCPCGRVSLFQTSLSPEENSQQFADWYSLLHVVFGMALFAFVAWMRPRWSVAAGLMAVLFGHTIWEIAENTPFVIHLFTSNPAAHSYSGDSILNSMGDTVFAMAGAFAMSRLSIGMALAVTLAVEVIVTIAVGDGFVVGTLRVLGVAI